MTEMNGQYCSTRPMHIGPAANKKSVTTQQSVYSNAQGNQSEHDPNNIQLWIFVGGLDPSVSDDILKQVFGQFGELIHVKIPLDKHCGFVQFANRTCAEQALSMLNGAQLGGQSVRLSWGCSPTSKQSDQSQWTSGYYGYTQGHAYAAYALPTQDPNTCYGGYGGGYGNYQQPGAYQPQQ